MKAKTKGLKLVENIKALELGMHWFPERPGGLDRVYHSLIQSLPGAGVDVRGLVAGNGQAERDTDGKVKSFAAQDASLLQRMIALRAAVQQEMKLFRPDVVAIHFAFYAASGMPTMGKIPKVMHFHGPWAYESGVETHIGTATRVKAAIERYVYHGAQHHIVLSNAFAKVLSEQYGVDRRTIDIVPGSVDANHYNVSMTQAEARRVLGLPLDRPIVVSVRRLVRRMGLEDLIDAVARLKQKWPDLLVVIGGKGRLAEELEVRAKAADIENNVKLLGFVPDEHLPLLYKAANFSIVPTVSFEGFGLITLESLASGTPVLVTPVGGLPEAVSGLSPNLVLQGTGARAVADGIDGALSGDLLLPDETACKAYVRDYFDLPVIARRTAAVYRKVIG